MMPADDVTDEEREAAAREVWPDDPHLWRARPHDATIVLTALCIERRKVRTLRKAAAHAALPDCNCDYGGRAIEKRGRVRHLAWCAMKTAPDLYSRMVAALDATRDAKGTGDGLD